jgi:hypothetical protein
MISIFASMMAKQVDDFPRATGRKAQLNIEVTDADKADFEKLAKACGVKLAALVRQLLADQAKRLGIPALLADYQTQQPDDTYQYRVPAQEVTETKLGVFRQFLQTFMADCDFSKTTFEANQYAADTTCTAYSSSGENSHTIWLGLAAEPEANYRERKEIDAIWHDVLGLSLLLEDKWNGVNYTVEARRTLNGKKILLKKFIEQHQGAKLKCNAAYNGGRVFKVVASTRKGQKELLIEYLPQRGGEVAELQQVLEEYGQ